MTQCFLALEVQDSNNLFLQMNFLIRNGLVLLNRSKERHKNYFAIEIGIKLILFIDFINSFYC